ncbi:MAG: PAS domain-containing sensor histidine kinase [Ginsengibacter sp.]
MQKPRFSDFDRLSAIVQASDDAIISRDLNGTITSWNSSAEKIFGYTAQEANGKHISIIIPEECIDEEEGMIKKIKNGGGVKKYEAIRKKKDGSRIFASHIITPVRDVNKKVIGTSKIISDISDQKALYAAIINTSDDAICSKTLDGIITSWNFGAEKMFGHKKKAVIGKHINIIVPPSKIKEDISIRNKIKSGKRVAPFETTRLRKDGSEVNISLTVSPIYNSTGKITGASTIAKDISKRKEIEEQHKLYTEKLEDLNRYRDDFIAMASHELNTPLTVIKVNLQLLEEIMHGDENVGFINNSTRQVNKLTDLISHLLDVSKIQAGVLKLDYESFDLKVLLKEICRNMHASNPSYKIRVERTKKPLIIHADKERIEHVINNLLLNAIKYSPDSKEIVVKSSIKNKHLQLSIADNGIGIPKKDLEKIFERFYRVQGIPSTYSGSGIGLFICSEIIAGHGGEIWAESELAVGSTITFRIPVRKAH